MANWFNSKYSYFAIDDTGGTLRDLSAFIHHLSDIPGERKLIKVTPLGASGEQWQPGLEDGLIKLEGTFHSRATSGPDAVLGPLRTHGSAVDWVYGPTGNVSGRVKYSGTCWVLNYSTKAKDAQLVAFSAILQVEGAITRGTI